MKQYVLSNKYELRRLTELLPQGAMIRVLRNSDVARVGNIVVLTAVGSKDEDDLVLEVAPPEPPAPTEGAATDTEGDIADTDDTPSDDDDEEEEEDKGYW